MVTRRRFLQSVAGSSAVVALSACAPAATQQGGPATVPTKQTWTVAANYVIANVDVALSNDSYGMLGHIYEALVDTQGSEFKLVGRLAERWERQNPTTVRFFLRKGVTFHNGQVFKAEDVEYTLTTLYGNPQHPYTTYVGGLSGVKIIDDYTIDISTKQANNVPYIYDLCKVYIAPKAYREANKAAFLDKPIGTGPYAVDQWLRNDRLILKANANYWRGKPTPENLIIRQLADPTTAAAELQAGGVDIVHDLDFLQAEPLKTNAEFEVLGFKGAQILLSNYSPLRTPMTDKRVRLALNYAVRRQELIDKVMLGNAVVMAGLFPKGFIGYDPNLKPFEYDPQRAKSLLAEAGYPNGFKTSWMHALASHRSPIWKQFFEAAAAQLKEVGVEVNVIPYQGATVNGPAWCVDNTPAHSPINSGTWGVGADPSTYLLRYYGSIPCRQSPALQEIYDRANTAPDLEKRTAALVEFSKAWQADAMRLEFMATNLLFAKKKNAGVTYQVAPYANGVSYEQFWDVASVKPLV